MTKQNDATTTSDPRDSYRPVIFDLKKKEAAKKFRLLKKNSYLLDLYAEQLTEYELVRQPSLLHRAAGTVRSVKNDTSGGIWAYYPWKDTLVHLLRPREFAAVRLSRNRELINTKEQRAFSGIRVGIAGLNVGNPAALCFALEGGARSMKFADNDTLSLSNLNRFRAGVCELGLNKAVLSARQAYEIDPYLDIEVWPHGLAEDTLQKFLLSPRLDVLIEEMDDLRLKVAIRKLARRSRIPVVMVTGNGSNVIVDVERYDIDPKTKLLNGYLSEQVTRRIETGDVKRLGLQKKIALMRDFMGSQKFFAKRLLASFPAVGSSLAGIPQLAESSYLRGAAVVYFTRELILRGKGIKSGRYLFEMDSLTPKRR